MENIFDQSHLNQIPFTSGRYSFWRTAWAMPLEKLVETVVVQWRTNWMAVTLLVLYAHKDEPNDLAPLQLILYTWDVLWNMIRPILIQCRNKVFSKKLISIQHTIFHQLHCIHLQHPRRSTSYKINRYSTLQWTMLYWSLTSKTAYV